MSIRTGKAKWRLVEAQDRGIYPSLEHVLALKSIDWEIIKSCYDEAVKFATAMKTGAAEPEDILRPFTAGNTPQHPSAPKVRWERWVVTILSAVAQAERGRILERTNEGRIDAKAKGVKFGRKPTVNQKKIIALRKQGVRAVDIAKQLSVGRSTVYKALKNNE